MVLKERRASTVYTFDILGTLFGVKFGDSS